MAETRSFEPPETLARTRADGPVLVAYASRNGATRGVAERIAERIGETGRTVELTPAAEVADLSGREAVVLGSAIYDGRWLPDAADFAQRNLGSLANRRVWLFSVGAFADTHRGMGWAMRRAPREIGALRRQIAPRDYRVFGGVIRREQWPWRGRALLRLLGGHLGDNRDWPAIDAWAGEIARSLRAA